MNKLKENVSKNFAKSKKAPLLLKMLFGRKAMATDPSPVVSKIYYGLKHYSIDNDVQKVHSKVMNTVRDLKVDGAEILSAKGIEFNTKKLLESSTQGKYGMLLTMIAKHFAPKNTIELGTCAGFSSMYILGGLEAVKELDYSFLSIEGSKSLVDLAQKNLHKFGANDRRYKLVNDYFENALPKLLHDNMVVDFVFVDGDHTYDATLKYFNWLIGNMGSDGIMMFDDIRWSHGMFKAWKTICTHKGIGISVDLGRMGLCVVKHDQTTLPKHFSFYV